MGFTTIFTDNFTRANESPLNPANWTAASDFPTDTLQVVSDSCQIVNDADFGGFSFYTGALIPNDQYVEATVGPLAGLVSVLGRSTGAYAESYEAVLGINPGPMYVVELEKHHSGSSSTIGGPVNLGSPINPGDKIRLEMSGSTISVLYNGVVKISVTDTGLTSGKTGLLVEISAVQSDTTVTRFETGGTVIMPESPTILGSFQGQTLAAAFANPNGLDLMQVINEGNKVVWNLTSSGVSNINPGSPTPNALLGKFFGSSFATAFPDNPNNFDIIQVIGQGGAVVFHVNSSGTASTP